jgi:NAD(P)-dependent dehydrogenase (short-subunit alcohol dehydrogenase family)
MELTNLKNKVAIVTGAARGMGESIAVELARYGANVVVSDIISGKGTIKKIKALKRDAIYIKADVSDENEVKNLINETVRKFKGIDKKNGPKQFMLI